MNFSNSYLFMLYVLVDLCVSFHPEYYLDNEDEDNSEKNITNVDTRRSNKDSVSVHSNGTNLVPREKMYNNVKSKPVKKNDLYSTVFRKTDVTEMKNQSYLFNMSTNDFPKLQFDHDYEYEYEIETSTHVVQTAETPPSSKSETTIEDFTPTEVDDVTQLYNNSIKYVADFYNIEPAVKETNVTDFVVGGSHNDTNNVWYVAEKSPCWELPVIFGTLGKKRKESKVFLVFPVKLKNVRILNVAEPTVPPYITPTVDKTLNKWCQEPPCFGDHSLCIFASKHASELCGAGYTIVTPSIIKRSAIVNTINSMRNRVATGDVAFYSHLPTAANMKQIVYDFSLETMAVAWLRQCLPGTDPCSSLDNHYVTQLECIKSPNYCCYKLRSRHLNIHNKCIPKYECFINPIIGCIYAWFGVAGKSLTETDIKCGHASPITYSTVQLLWAQTNKIGCAYGRTPAGDARVLCNFAPGAPFFIQTKYYCGLIKHRRLKINVTSKNIDLMNPSILASFGIKLQGINNALVQHRIYLNHDNSSNDDASTVSSMRLSELDDLNTIYTPGMVRKTFDNYENGTLGMIARLTTRYTFIEEKETKCDTGEPIYAIGPPGSQCVESGRTYHALCYNFVDTTPGYRLGAILATIALFSLILYDLFSGVMRQTNF